MPAMACSALARMPAVDGVDGFLPCRQFLCAGGFAEGCDDPGSLVAAVAHDRHLGALLVYSGGGECFAVVTVARLRFTDSHSQAGIGIDHDLQVGRVAVVLR